MRISDLSFGGEFEGGNPYPTLRLAKAGQGWPRLAKAPQGWPRPPKAPQGPFEQIPPALSQIGPPKKSKTSKRLETSSPKYQKHRFGSRHPHQNTKNIDLARDILTKIPKTSIWLETSSPKYQKHRKGAKHPHQNTKNI